MKAIHFKALCALVSASLFCVATLISSQSSHSVFGFDRPLGQDKAGKNCERIDTPRSSTFGKCENVCKDKEVTRDAPNNRWVCKASKSVGGRPQVERVPIGGKIQEPTANPSPKQLPRGGPKAGKVIKN